MHSGAFRLILRRDLERNRWPLDRATVIIFRLGQLTRGRNVLFRASWALLDFIWLRLLVGAELPPSVEAGPGLRLPHAGRGVILHPATRLGRDVTLYHRVTVGNHGTSDIAPTLGDDVYVGTGATILGDITLGDRCAVGAGAVVVKSAPDGATLVGVPAHRKAPSGEALIDDMH